MHSSEPKINQDGSESNVSNIGTVSGALFSLLATTSPGYSENAMQNLLATPSQAISHKQGLASERIASVPKFQKVVAKLWTASHRSHRSHSSHRSHYSSRGGRSYGGGSSSDGINPLFVCGLPLIVLFLIGLASKE